VANFHPKLGPANWAENVAGPSQPGSGRRLAGGVGQLNPPLASTSIRASPAFCGRSFTASSPEDGVRMPMASSNVPKPCPVKSTYPGSTRERIKKGTISSKQEGKSTAKPRCAQRRSPVRLLPFSLAAVSFPLPVQAAPSALTSHVFTRSQAPLGLLAGLHRGHAVGSIKAKGRCL